MFSFRICPNEVVGEDSGVNETIATMASSNRTIFISMSATGLTWEMLSMRAAGIIKANFGSGTSANLTLPNYGRFARHSLQLIRENVKMIFGEDPGPNSQERSRESLLRNRFPQTVLRGNAISNIADTNNEAPAKTRPPQKLPVALLTEPSA